MFFLGIADFLPMFIYVLVQDGLVTAEIEADYMWGLLHPCLLAGEGGYYLTTLSSAVHILKNIKMSMQSMENQEVSWVDFVNCIYIIIRSVPRTFLQFAHAQHDKL